MIAYQFYQVSVDKKILHFLLYKMCSNYGPYITTCDHGFAMSASNFCLMSLLIVRSSFVLVSVLTLYDALILFLALLESSFDYF